MSEGEATDPRCAECQDVSAAYCDRCAPAVFDAVQSRIKVKPEGATDPLREALEAIVAVADHCGGYRGAVGMGMMETIAREALAVAPEPEWEYRAIRGHTYSGAWPSEAKARYHGALGFGPDAPFTIERRRKAGEWEALPDDQ